MSEQVALGVFRKTPLEAGIYFVATPIGSARDITLRALDILASADVIAAEDTRTARKLMELHGVPVAGRPMVAYHDHNGAERRPRLLAAAAEGKSVAYVSEAGTPLVADPGYQLGHEAAQAGIKVLSAPGPSAVLAALCVSGLPSDRFQFLGFAPTATQARKGFARVCAQSAGTSVIFESAKRVHLILGDLREACGDLRAAALCRELTKRFEETRRGTLAELADSVAADQPRGECVIVVDRAPAQSASVEDIDAALRAAMAEMSMRDAAAFVAAQFDEPKRAVYQRALSLERD